MRFVEAEKIIRQGTNIRRPLAEVKISPRLTRSPFALQLRIEDAVVPREERHDPEIVKSHRARPDSKLSAQREHVLQLRKRIVLRAAHPELVIAGREK